MSDIAQYLPLINAFAIVFLLVHQFVMSLSNNRTRTGDHRDLVEVLNRHRVNIDRTNGRLEDVEAQMSLSAEKMQDFAETSRRALDRIYKEIESNGKKKKP